MKNALLLATLTLSSIATVSAQIQNNDVWKELASSPANVRQEIAIPSVDGLMPLKGDFHIHTIYSDGHVRPAMRVKEAWQNGLDVIAITDHSEYRPMAENLKGDRNESYNQAKAEGDKMGVMVIQATEISKSKPFGHMNALFINDAEPIYNNDPLVAVDEALKQGAFVMWNHPGWPDDKSTMYPVHEKLIKDGKIHGIEVYNYYEYYPVSFDWCNQHKLAYMSNTDAHEPIRVEFGTNMPPYTIVYAKERSLEAVREGLDNALSVAVFNNQLAAPEALLKKMLKAMLTVKPVNDKRVDITNTSDIPVVIKEGDNLMVIAPRTTAAYTKPAEPKTFSIENFHTGAGKKLTISTAELF